jgi:hypothetical protein
MPRTILVVDDEDIARRADELAQAVKDLLSAKKKAESQLP